MDLCWLGFMLVALECSQAPGATPKSMVQYFPSGKSTLLPSGSVGGWTASLLRTWFLSIPAPQLLALG